MQDWSREDAGSVEYIAPRKLSDVFQVLRQRGEDAKLIAGGQSLLVFLRQGLIAPAVLVGLREVGELRGLVFSGSDGQGTAGLHIGAMVTQAEIERAPGVRDHYAALGDAAAVVATVQVRNQGTIGGNLCHADPTADPPAALIALGATLRIARMDGSRTVPVEEFFRAYMDVDLAPDEVLTAIMLPPPAPYSGSAYLKLRVRQVDTALVGAAAWVQLEPDGDAGGHEPRVRDVRIGLSGAGATPLRAVAAEHELRGATASDAALARAAAAAASACEPLSDTEASAWYRREMVGTLVQRALQSSLASATRRSAP